MDEVFTLPEIARVQKFIPKNKFYNKTNISTKVRREFIDIVQKITWQYKLAEETVGISKTKNVIEIQIFFIELKKKVIPKNVLKTIDKSIPYQILYVFIFENQLAYAITLKEKNKPQNYYYKDWDESITFNFTGTTLEHVYQNIITAFIPDDHKKMNANFSDIICRDDMIQSLKKEIESLKRKRKNEKQFNRKTEIHKTLLEKQNELNAIIKEG